MIKLYRKYKEFINYLIFGFLTTLVSIGSYYVLSLIFNLKNNIFFLLANILSWFFAVTFAYITNKRYVFKSESRKIVEFIKFVISRIITLLIELIGMFVLVKLLKINDVFSKSVMQIVVIILNYVISKMMVFKR